MSSVQFVARVRRKVRGEVDVGGSVRVVLRDHDVLPQEATLLQGRAEPVEHPGTGRAALRCRSPTGPDRKGESQHALKPEGPASP